MERNEWKELTIDEKILDQLSDKIASKIGKRQKDDTLSYGEIARFKSCSIEFSMDNKHRDEFLIKDNDGRIVGEFKEVIRCNKCAFRGRSERNLWCDIFGKIVPEDGFCCFGETAFEE